MLLVTGASGVGKSTVRRLIAEELAPEVPVIDTTELTPAEAAADVVAWCRALTKGG
jgi:adenylate kinase family enzyme